MSGEGAPQRGMHGYCGGYWIGPVATEEGGQIDVCNGCGMERRHERRTPTRKHDA